MKENKLIKISLVCSFVGLFGLFYISGTTEFEAISIADITPEYMDNTVKICGNVYSYRISKTNHVFMIMKDSSGSINVVVFNTSSGKVGLNPYEIVNGDLICLTGRVDIYNNGLEIIANKIEAGK